MSHEERPRKVSSKLRSIEEDLRSVLLEVEATEQEGEPAQIRLEVIMKRCKYPNNTSRRIKILEHSSDREELEKLDSATEVGSPYCIVRIRLLPKSRLS